MSHNYDIIFRLEAAARQVSGATSQLLVACKVKADPDSETMHRLDKAGYAVKKASEDLTKAAKDAREAKEDSQVRFKVFSKKILKFEIMKNFHLKSLGSK